MLAAEQPARQCHGARPSHVAVRSLPLGVFAERRSESGLEAASTVLRLKEYAAPRRLAKHREQIYMYATYGTES